MSTETASPKAPIDFTNFWSADNFYFFVCLALALIVVFLFGMQKFAETSVERNEEDFTTQLLPKYLATPQEYSRALMFYLGTLVALVGLLSILGPRVIGVEMAKNTPPESLPLFFALILVGLTPEMPWLQDLERALRRFSHERAFIPTAARAIAEKLTTAEFDFSSYQATAVLRSSMMRGVEAADFGQPRDSIEYNWARLSCLLHELRRRQDAGLTKPSTTTSCKNMQKIWKASLSNGDHLKTMLPNTGERSWPIRIIRTTN